LNVWKWKWPNEEIKKSDQFKHVFNSLNHSCITVATHIKVNSNDFSNWIHNLSFNLFCSLFTACRKVQIFTQQMFNHLTQDFSLRYFIIHTIRRGAQVQLLFETDELFQKFYSTNWTELFSTLRLKWTELFKKFSSFKKNFSISSFAHLNGVLNLSWCTPNNEQQSNRYNNHSFFLNFFISLFIFVLKRKKDT